MYINSTYVIIPAYEPDERMLETINELTAKTSFNIIVVNDGSSNEKSKLFLKASEKATVICHDKNRGKGAAIKTAMRYIRNSSDDAIIVVADADGQHKTKDIIRVAQCAETNRDKLVLGCRKFTGKVPFKSKFGNKITRGVFTLVSGRKLSDTQTGLRGFSSRLIPFLQSVKGDRYEFEMNTLLECAKENISSFEVPIETVYIGKNETSHFHPIKDSFIIYRDILKFTLSSAMSFLVDYLLYSVLFLTSGSLILSNIGARTMSSVFNYTVNRKFVFEHKESVAASAAKYFCLCAFILFANTVILKFLTMYVISNAYIAKIITEVMLFFVSWIIQKQYVFKKEVKTI